MGLWDTNDLLILARSPDIMLINKKKRTFYLVDFAVPRDHREKIKESEGIDKYLDLAREQPPQETQQTMEPEGDGDTSCSCCI